MGGDHEFGHRNHATHNTGRISHPYARVSPTQFYIQTRVFAKESSSGGQYMDTERDCAPGAACSTRSNHISRALLHITHPTAPSYVRSRGPNQYLTNDIPSTTFGIEAPPCACEGYRPLAAPSSRRNSSTAHRSSLRRSLVQDQTPANGRTPPHPRMPRSQDRVTATATQGHPTRHTASRPRAFGARAISTPVGC